MSEHEFNDEFSPFQGSIVGIETENHKLPLYGRVKTISSDFLTVEKKDGRTVIISKKAILQITAMKNQAGSI